MYIVTTRSDKNLKVGAKVRDPVPDVDIKVTETFEVF